MAKGIFNTFVASNSNKPPLSNKPPSLLSLPLGLKKQISPPPDGSATKPAPPSAWLIRRVASNPAGLNTRSVKGRMSTSVSQRPAS